MCALYPVFTQWLTSCKTKGQYHNQDVDVDIIKIRMFSSRGFLTLPFYIYIYFCLASTPPLTLTTTNLFSIVIVLSSEECYTNGITQHVNSFYKVSVTRPKIDKNIIRKKKYRPISLTDIDTKILH